jgi:hypothetical protein
VRIEGLLLSLVGERGLPQEEHGDVRRDERDGDPRTTERGVGIADRDHDDASDRLGTGAA